MLLIVAYKQSYKSIDLKSFYTKFKRTPSLKNYPLLSINYPLAK